MPTYDYLCPNGHRFEVIHGIEAAGPTVCPICQASPVRKAFSAPSIHFKGTGWAKKDRGATSRAAAKAGSDGKDAATGGAVETAGASGKDGSSAEKPGEKSTGEASGGAERAPSKSGGSGP